MLYILEQRLSAQNVQSEKSVRVLCDVVRTMFSARFVAELFKPQWMYKDKSIRQIFDKLAHSSIMKLNETSMSKLYSLMVMGVGARPLRVPALYDATLQHLSELRSMPAKRGPDAKGGGGAASPGRRESTARAELTLAGLVSDDKAESGNTFRLADGDDDDAALPPGPDGFVDAMITLDGNAQRKSAAQRMDELGLDDKDDKQAPARLDSTTARPLDRDRSKTAPRPLGRLPATARCPAPGTTGGARRTGALVGEGRMQGLSAAAAGDRAGDATCPSPRISLLRESNGPASRASFGRPELDP
ncbi:organic solute transport protein 1 [Aureococcus anophagefferens]|nr:organic solute transport protein 1 [Aureococcus anophagefferens]